MFKLSYADFYLLLGVKFMITLVIGLFILHLYYDMFRYMVGAKSRRQRKYSTLSYMYTLTSTITLTILAFGILYFMWKGTIFSYPDYIGPVTVTVK